MRILYFSDLHFEMPRMRTALLPDMPDPDTYDVVVAAGDIGYRLDGIKWLERNMPQDKPVIFVPGNHEYYTSNFADVKKMFAEYDGRVIILDPGMVTIEDVTFIGATMWSDLKLEGFRTLPDETVKYWIADFKWGWTPAEMRAVHEQEVDFVVDQLLAKDDNTKTVVITHFVPTQIATSPRFIGDVCNPYFLNDQDWIMDQFAPNAWIFGHTHDRFDFIHPSGTHVVGNPHGYVGETPNFEWKILEI